MVRLFNDSQSDREGRPYYKLLSRIRIFSRMVGTTLAVALANPHPYLFAYSRGDPRGRPGQKVRLLQLEERFALGCRRNDLLVFDNFDQLSATLGTPNH